MNFQAWKIKLLNSMTFQVFHDLHEPWFTCGREAETEKKYLRFKNIQIRVDEALVSNQGAFSRKSRT